MAPGERSQNMSKAVKKALPELPTPGELVEDLRHAGKWTTGTAGR